MNHIDIGFHYEWGHLLLCIPRNIFMSILWAKIIFFNVNVYEPFLAIVKRFAEGVEMLCLRRGAVDSDEDSRVHDENS